jgi:DNA-binding NarL/FixJ family response regulator
MAVSALETEPAILVVEDDPLLGAEISNVLERLRFRITGIASTAHEALSLLEMSAPQLALIDARLEGAVTAEELAGAFHRLGIATVFIGGEPNIAPKLAAHRPPLVATISGAFCPSSVFKTICEMIPEDQEAC